MTWVGVHGLVDYPNTDASRSAKVVNLFDNGDRENALSANVP
jgi:hypothetical protein